MEFLRTVLGGAMVPPTKPVWTCAMHSQMVVEGHSAMVGEVPPKELNDLLLADRLITQDLVGVKLCMQDIGEGMIKRVEFPEQGGPKVFVEFADRERVYKSLDHFCSAVLSPGDPRHLRVAIRLKWRRSKEKRIIQERNEQKRLLSDFLDLGRRYFAVDWCESDLNGETHRLLKRIDAGDALAEVSQCYLEKSGQLGVLASYNEKRFRLEPQRIGLAVEACKHWRRAGHPDKGVLLLHTVLWSNTAGEDTHIVAMAWTTYGSALKDLDLMGPAEDAAIRAIEMERDIGEERHQPHCLLAAIYRQQNKLEKSEDHHIKAKKIHPKKRRCTSEDTASIKTSRSDKAEIRRIVMGRFNIT